jgi:DNA-binding winged helix-turn-helix (wHTH) protein
MATMSTVSIRSISNSQSAIGVQPRGPRLVTDHHDMRSAYTKEFPPFRLDTGNQCLWRRGDGAGEERIVLKPKVFAVLRYLVEHAGRLVTQDELLDAVWPDTHVQPEVLKRHIFDIRGVLGDDPKNPIYIETLPRRGYQFIAAVRSSVSEELVAADASARTKLMGRDAALGGLRECLERAFGGQRQVVFVTGEPGVGKTALVDEFQLQAGAGAPIQIGRGQCVEGYGGKEAYYPVLKALGELCSGREGGFVARVLAAQAPTWLMQLPSLVPRQEREALERETQRDTRQRMLREIGNALEIIAAERPLLLVLEDLQWVDPSTVDLISVLARGRGPTKLMVIGTYRPADLALANRPLRSLAQDLSMHRLCHKLALQPLSEKEIARYLAGEQPDASLPDGLAKLLHRHSEGNPLFMVAALEHVTNRGLVSRENGGWQLRVPVQEIDLEVPENLRQMIEIQIDGLSREQRRGLEAASVVGTLFSAAVSAPAAGMDVEEFETLCEGLSRRHYIVRSADRQEFPDGSSSDRYEFVHALYREVLYWRQSPGRRAKLHLQVAERMETLYARHLSQIATELARHFERGGDGQRAMKYCPVAADSAGLTLGPRPVVEIL